MTEAINTLLTVEDVMANLRISRPTLYRLLKSGHLIPVRIGKRTLFDPADIRAFVEASKQVVPFVEKGQPIKAGRDKSSRPCKAAKPIAPEVSVEPGTGSDEVVKKTRNTKQPQEKPFEDEDKQGRLL
jgi:excisionase family DNA binding protein